jgi:hypothetical protein
LAISRALNDILNRFVEVGEMDGHGHDHWHRNIINLGNLMFEPKKNWPLLVKRQQIGNKIKNLNCLSFKYDCNQYRKR